MSRFNVLVVWAGGDEEFVSGPDGNVAVFSSMDKAQEIADGFRAGIDGRQVQSISVVRESRAAAAMCPHCNIGRMTVSGDGALWCDHCEVSRD